MMQPPAFHYSLILECDPQDAIYVVTIPELLGCMTHGHTYEEAIRNAKDAIAAWIDGAEQIGLPIPAPRVFTASQA